MSASEHTKLQVNYSAKNGLMVNIYGDNQAEIETLLANVQDLAPLILSVEQSLKSAGAPAPVYNSAPVRKPTPQQTTQLPPNEAPQCAHGPMRYNEGVSAKGPWKGWMCSAAKGVTPRCNTIWA